MKIVTGPDFPTGGFIYGREEIRKSYVEGRGVLQMRARAGIDRIGRGAQERDAIVVTEIPFQVNKARLHRAHRRARERKEARRNLRSARRIGPRRNAHRRRVETRRRAAGRAQQALQTHADAVVVRHDQSRDRQRPAARAQPQADARGVYRVSPRGRAQAHGVRAAQGASARAHSRRAQQSDRCARLHHHADPQLAFSRRSAAVVDRHN